MQATHTSKTTNYANVVTTCCPTTWSQQHWP